MSTLQEKKIEILDYNSWYDLMDAHWSYEGEENIGENLLECYLARTAGCKIDILATTKETMFLENTDTLVPIGGQWFTTEEKRDLYFETVEGDPNTITGVGTAYELGFEMAECFSLYQTYLVVTGIEKKSNKLIEEVVEATSDKDLRRAKYKGLMLYVSDYDLTKDVHGRIIDTPDNLEYYGIYVWEGRTYSPGLSGYHSSSRLFRSEQHESAKYRIGFEIEKESDRRSALSSEYLYARYNWLAERDSSLGSQGYELVSPIYNLLSRKTIKSDLEALRSFIDGGQEEQGRCGGHINISKKGQDGFKLLTELKGFLPLLYAMYPNRVTNSYSRAKDFQSYIDYPSKQAVYPKADRLELRIFPVVDTVEDLMLRYELVRYMMTQSTKSPATVVRRLLDPTTRLHTIISELGFEPKVLAQAMLEADAKYDNTKYTENTHVEISKLGLTIKTKIKPTVKTQRKLKAEFNKFCKSQFMKTFVDEDGEGDDKYINREVMQAMRKRFRREFL